MTEWSRYQREIFAFVENDTRSALIQAVAGSGKTTSIVEAANRVPADTECLFLAFNKAIADELQTRLPAHFTARTLNSLGHGAVYKARDGGPLVLDDKKVAGLFDQQYAGTDASQDRGVVLKLIGLAKSYALSADNDDDWWAFLIEHHGLYTEQLSDERLIHVARSVLKENNKLWSVIDFDDQIYLPVMFNLRPKRYSVIFVDEAQDLSRAQRLLVRLTLAPGGRVIAVGDRAQCHPPYTRISITGKGYKPIAEVQVGDRVVTYHDVFRGLKSQGRPVEAIHARPYIGRMLNVQAGGEAVEVTPNHRMLTKYNQDLSGWALYLMETGETSRVGACQLYYNGGFGPAMRARHEGADRLWVLDVFEDKGQARIEETLTSLKYGIPEQCRMLEKGGDKEQLLAAIGDNRDQARDCLTRHGRLWECPLWERGNGAHLGKCYSFVTAACNLIPGYNLVRTYDGTRSGGSWAPVNVMANFVETTIYSMQVGATEGGLRLYVADNILVHNSIYGWRGASHDSMDQIQRAFDCVELPLSICYRCPTKVIELAKTIVPEIEARPGAPEGEVAAPAQYSPQDFEPTDLVVSRKNAPLVSFAYKLLGEGVACHVMGRDIGKSLVSLIGRFKAATVSELLQKVETWKTRESNRLFKADKEAQAQAVIDKCDTLWVIASWTESEAVSDLLAEIERMFVNEDDRRRKKRTLRLATVHKAKGLEADRVWILDPGDMPVPWAKKKWEEIQERNLQYVAYTRPRQALFFIETEGLTVKQRQKEEAAA